MGKKETISLRRRTLRTGNVSLYLDIYRNGRREYEYLKLYLVPEKTRKDRDANKDTLALAEAVRAKRTVELRNGEFGFANNGNSTPFFDYFRTLCANRQTSEGSASNWKACLQYLEHYDHRSTMTIGEVNKRWLEGFIRFMNKQPISVNSKWLYVSKLRACFNTAIKEGLIRSNPMAAIPPMKREEVSRVFLTLDELRTLVDAPCKHEDIKNMFLFSCLTGLRWSDVSTLDWSNVQQGESNTRIVFRQKKTKGLEYLDISPSAVAFMGQRPAEGGLVFNKQHSLPHVNIMLKRWVATAGIDKHISFHCARHTFAVMMLDIGTDIYTVSKLLGHRELSTTQVYAKVLDKNKQAAVARIPDITNQPKNEKT